MTGDCCLVIDDCCPLVTGDCCPLVTGDCCLVTGDCCPLVNGDCCPQVIWCLGGVSGAHINPCVSLTMFVTRRMSLTRCVAYSIVQCLGATVGAALLWGLTPAHRRGKGFKSSQAWCWWWWWWWW